MKSLLSTGKKHHFDFHLYDYNYKKKVKKGSNVCITYQNDAIIDKNNIELHIKICNRSISFKVIFQKPAHM